MTENRVQIKTVKFVLSVPVDLSIKDKKEFNKAIADAHSDEFFEDVLGPNVDAELLAEAREKVYELWCGKYKDTDVSVGRGDDLLFKPSYADPDKLVEKILLDECELLWSLVPEHRRC